MKWWRSIAALGFALALSLSTRVAKSADAADDPLKSKDLVKSGSAYVLPVEQELADGMKNLRKLKVKLDADSKQRRDLEAQLKIIKNGMSQGEYQRRTIYEHYLKAQDITIKNNDVAQINILESKLNEANDARMKLESTLNGLGAEEKMQFINQVIDLGQKVDAGQDKYKELGDDPDVKGALEKMNAPGKPKMKLGPSESYTVNVNLLKKWRNEIASDTIRLKQEHEVSSVEVTFNGNVTRQVIVDSGASLVCLTASLAEQLKMVPTDKDETIRCTLADGRVVEAKHMVIKSVRVGQFTVTDVDCAVMPKEMVAAEPLLGGTFLNNFIFKIDPKAGEMHLAVIAGNSKVTTAAPPRDAKDTKKKTAADSK